MNAIKLFLPCLLVALPGVIAAQQDDKGLDPTTFDTNIRPQDDLYRAVNGSWLAATDIPSDKSNYGSFSVLADAAEKQIREIIEEAGQGSHPAGSDAQKVGDFYKSFMDVERVEALGHSPLGGELEKIASLDRHADVLQHMGYLQQRGVDTPIGFFVTIDAKNSTRYLAALIQSGTTLPDRDYYLKDDEKYVSTREELKKYINQLFELADFQDARHGKEILDLETRLAEAHWTRTRLRDANARYNLYQVSDLQRLGTGIDWPAFFTAAAVPDIREINVMTPSYFEALDGIFTETPVELWKHYLAFKLLDASAPVLSRAFVDAHFQMHDKTLAGTPEQKPRWKNGVGLIAGTGVGSFGALGEVVGRMYVERHFPKENKEKMDQLVQNLLQAFGESIDELTWMTDATKARARENFPKSGPRSAIPMCGGTTAD